jgi:hypothetical protein
VSVAWISRVVVAVDRSPIAEWPFCRQSINVIGFDVRETLRPWYVSEVTHYDWMQNPNGNRGRLGTILVKKTPPHGINTNAEFSKTRITCRLNKSIFFTGSNSITTWRMNVHARTCKSNPGKKNGCTEIVMVLRHLIKMPWRRMGQWIYSVTILVLTGLENWD